MGVAFVFIVVEYCTQSHLSTEDYDDAMRGLKRTRRFKKYTAWLRDVPDYIIDFIKRLWSHMLRRNKRLGDDGQSGRYGLRGRRSLLWTWQTNHQRGRTWRDSRGVIEGIPLHRQISPEESRRNMLVKSSRSPSSARDTELAPYTSPTDFEGEYPPELPMHPVEIPLEDGRFHRLYRHY